MGYVAYLQGDYALAHRLLRETLAICREIDHRRAYASALNALGRLALEIEEVGEAWSYLSEALTTATQIRARPLMLDILENMAEARVAQGQLESALGILSVVLNHPATDRQTGDRARKIRSSWAATLPTEQTTGSNSTLEELAEQMARGR
jgi:tetratricopeptide (TPR) repeat protein